MMHTLLQKNKCEWCITKLSEMESDSFTQVLDNILNECGEYRDCVYCPVILNKSALITKLKAMLRGMDLTRESKHYIIRKHKIFDTYLLHNGESLNISGMIRKHDAHMVLNNIDKLYSVCPNCIYFIVCILMYETTPHIAKKAS